MVSAETNLPESFDPATGLNMRWKADLGTDSYATPVVANAGTDQTVDGATFVLLAPEHALVERLAAESADPAAFRASGTSSSANLTYREMRRAYSSTAGA